jgi:hypothetical protein
MLESPQEQFEQLILNSQLDPLLISMIEGIKSTNQIKVTYGNPNLTIIGGGNLGWGLHLDVLLQNSLTCRKISPTVVIPRITTRAAREVAYLRKTGGTVLTLPAENLKYFVPVRPEEMIGIWESSRFKKQIEISEMIFIIVPDIAVARRSIIDGLLALNVDLNHKSIILTPGGTGSPFDSLRILQKFPEVTIGLIETSPYAVRMNGEVMAHRKTNVKVATFPIPNAIELAKRLNEIFPLRPCYEAVNHPISLILEEFNYILHVAVAFDENNLKRLKTGFQYNHYIDGITREVAKNLNKLDQERMAIAQIFGIQVDSILEWLDRAYQIGKHENLHEAFQACKDFYTFLTPSIHDLPTHRMVTEDIPAISIILKFAEIAGITATVTEQLRNDVLKTALSLGASPKVLSGYGDSIFEGLPNTPKEFMSYFENLSARVLTSTATNV